MLKNKKAIELSLTVVVVAAILLITTVVLLAIFYGLIGKESEQAQALIGDYDGDGILDMADKCPCNAGSTEFGGCTNALYQDYKENPGSIKRDCVIKKQTEKTNE